MIATPNCYTRACRHFRGVKQADGSEESEAPVCPAFPDGIPHRIANGSDTHKTMALDQVGTVVYERKPE